MKVRFDPRAEDDLKGILEYLLAETLPRVAGDYARRIHAACMALDLFPNRGAPRPEIGPGVRVLGFERRVAIAYRVDDGVVAILRIYYGGRSTDPDGEF